MSSKWPTAPLGELCDVQIGKTPTRATSRFWGEGHPWLSISDMNQGKDIWVTRESITPTAVATLNCRLVAPETVLLSFKLSIGKVGIARIPLYTNEAIAHLPIVDDRLDRDFLYWALRTIRLTDAADRAAMGATLNTGKLKKVEIPLPPMEEQQRIAAVLDAADELRAMRRRTLHKFDTLTQSVFVEMFGNPASTCDAPRKALGEVAVVVTGNTPSRRSAENYGDHIEWLKSDNILASGDVTPAREGLSELGRRKGREAPSGATLVVCIAGSPKSIGRVGFLDRSAAFNQQINAVIPGPDLLPTFLFHQLRIGQRLIQRASTNSMKGMVSKSALAAVTILLPPMDEQQRFVDFVTRAKAVEEKAVGSLHELDALLASLQLGSFQGEL